MVDPTTVNTSLAIPIRGTDVGTWDLPVNGNFVAIDSMFGGIATVALSSQTVTLLSSQAQCSIIRLTGTLLSNVAIVLPSIFKSWTVDNQITNSPSSFAVTFNTSTVQLGIPPGANDILFQDGTNIHYKNMGKIGEYWDYAAISVPTWVTSGIPANPYLLCNGTTFSSATYPVLANILGTTTLPDARGRVRIAMNAGTGRTTGVIADTIFTGGGDQNLQAHQHTGSGTTSGQSADHTHTGSGTTSTESVLHSHTGSGTTSGVNTFHTHHISFVSGAMNSNASHTHTSNGVANTSPAGAIFSAGAVFPQNF